MEILSLRHLILNSLYLDESPQKSHCIYEEEVLRAGILVNQCCQLTRGYNGKTFSRLGMHKKTGRGEGASGLKSDCLASKKGTRMY